MTTINSYTPHLHAPLLYAASQILATQILASQILACNVILASRVPASHSSTSIPQIQAQVLKPSITPTWWPSPHVNTQPTLSHSSPGACLGGAAETRR